MSLNVGKSLGKFLDRDFGPKSADSRRRWEKLPKARRIAIGVNEPEFAAAKVFEQRARIGVGNLSGPNHFGVVDVSAVVDPFLAYIVTVAVVHENEMFPGNGFQLLRELKGVRLLLDACICG